MSFSKGSEKKVADILLDTEIFSISFDPPFTLHSGIISPLYIDNRMLISFPKERALVIQGIVELIKSDKALGDAQYISSSISNSAPFGVLVAEALSLPLILVREQRKTHGKLNILEGRVPKGARVLVVEDLVATPQALLHTVEAVRESGGVIDHAVTIVDFELEATNETLKQAGVALSSVTKARVLVDEAIQKGILKAGESDEVLEWFKNPVGWGETRGYYAVTLN